MKASGSPHTISPSAFVRQWQDLSEGEQTTLLAKIHTSQSKKKHNQGKHVSVTYVGNTARPKKIKRQQLPQDDLSAYRVRNQLLQEMGFPSYQDYLKSPLWKSIRAKVLKRSRQCHVCPARATEAHHGSYRREDLDGTDLSHIYPICRACHQEIEYRGRDHKKLTPQQATGKMKNLRIEQRQVRKQQIAETFVPHPFLEEFRSLARKIRSEASL